MKRPFKRNVALILPYAVWMAMMLALPSTPECYAARTFVVALLLMPCLFYLKRHSAAIRMNRAVAPSMLWGLLGGLFVAVIWVAPESLAWYRRWCIIGEGGTTNVGESDMLLLMIRLIGSAFVISVAEELFFRRWLLRFAGFGWMVALFALEHDRWLVGAIAGAVYGLLAIRRDLSSAIVAHIVTNLALGLYVIQTDSWQFW